MLDVSIGDLVLIEVFVSKFIMKGDIFYGMVLEVLILIF